MDTTIVDEPISVSRGVSAPEPQTINYTISARTKQMGIKGARVN